MSNADVEVPEKDFDTVNCPFDSSVNKGCIKVCVMRGARLMGVLPEVDDPSEWRLIQVDFKIIAAHPDHAPIAFETEEVSDGG